jgi:hypothetical protein
MTDHRLFLVHSAQQPSVAALALRSQADETTQAWETLRTSLVGKSSARTRQDQIDIDVALRELSRAEPMLTAWSAPESAGPELRSSEAIWTLAVLVWASTLLLVIGLIGAAAYLLGRG